MAHRYFLTELYDHKVAKVMGDDAVHLIRVMRVNVGDSLTLCDQNGMDYPATITAIDGDDCLTCTVGDCVANPANPTKNLVVYMALPKGDKLEFVVQKCCELGASKLIPFESAYCVAKKSKKDDQKRSRLQKIALEACKQSGRSTPMDVAPTMTFGEVVQDLKHQDVNLFFYEHATVPLSQIGLGDAHSVGVIVGSEGGFNEKEEAQFMAAGAHTVSLGKRILRCETAAVTGVSLTMYLMGELE